MKKSLIRSVTNTGRDGVCGGQALMLSIINEIVFANAGDKYKELLNELMKSGMFDEVKNFQEVSF